MTVSAHGERDDRRHRHRQVGIVNLVHEGDGLGGRGAGIHGSPYGSRVRGHRLKGVICDAGGGYIPFITAKEAVADDPWLLEGVPILINADGLDRMPLRVAHGHGLVGHVRRCDGALERGGAFRESHVGVALDVLRREVPCGTHADGAPILDGAEHLAVIIDAYRAERPLEVRGVDGCAEDGVEG